MIIMSEHDNDDVDDDKKQVKDVGNNDGINTIKFKMKLNTRNI